MAALYYTLVLNLVEFQVYGPDMSIFIIDKIVDAMVSSYAHLQLSSHLTYSTFNFLFSLAFVSPTLYKFFFILRLCGR